MTDKVYDLRREVKQLKEKKGISSLVDVFKKWSDDDLDKILNKISKKVFEPIIASKISQEEKIDKLIKIVGNNVMGVKLDMLSSSYDFNLVEEVVYFRAFTKKNRPAKESVRSGRPLQVTVYGDGLEETTLSILEFSVPKKVYSTTWRLSRYSSDYKKIVDLQRILSAVYLANELQKFIDKNKDIKQYIILKEDRKSVV